MVRSIKACAFSSVMRPFTTTDATYSLYDKQHIIITSSNYHGRL
jgi:hypothetical protein